uniref:Translocating chain-associated membrane protein n=1 Tax=Parascaris univalens TaxID=6257 RepID=A0A915B643_PARUN
MVESRRSVGGRGKKASPPFLSHEFIIQNHGDIMSCILMIVIVGLLFQATSSFASIFVVPQYNETFALTPDSEPAAYYRTGFKDIAAIAFYAVGWITVHAILQEYIFDKLQRKLHLSKTKMSKFAESGQLFVFALYSAIHAGYVLHDLHIHMDITKLWVGYPEIHRHLTLHTKLFFIFQIAYWMHQFPEFYFQKVRKEDMQPRTVYSLIYLIFTLAAYILNFNRLALTLLFLEYISQSVFHLTRLFHFAEKWNLAKTGFKIWNAVFVLVRLASAVIAVLTLWYGLRSNETPYMDPANGNFNTAFIRLNSMLCALALQLYMLWNFVLFHVRRYRERHSKPKAEKQPRVQQKKKRHNVDDVRDLPEADQHSKKKIN